MTWDFFQLVLFAEEIVYNDCSFYCAEHWFVQLWAYADVAEWRWGIFEFLLEIFFPVDSLSLLYFVFLFPGEIFAVMGDQM